MQTIMYFSEIDLMFCICKTFSGFLNAQVNDVIAEHERVWSGKMTSWSLLCVCSVSLMFDVNDYIISHFKAISLQLNLNIQIFLEIVLCWVCFRRLCACVVFWSVDNKNKRSQSSAWYRAQRCSVLLSRPPAFCPLLEHALYVCQCLCVWLQASSLTSLDLVCAFSHSFIITPPPIYSEPWLRLVPDHRLRLFMTNTEKRV